MVYSSWVDKHGGGGGGGGGARGHSFSFPLSCGVEAAAVGGVVGPFVSRKWGFASVGELATLDAAFFFFAGPDGEETVEKY